MSPALVVNQINASPLILDTQKGKSVTSISMNERILGTVAAWVDKFDKVYSKRAFIHQYTGACIQRGEFEEVRSRMRELMRSYDELFIETAAPADSDYGEYY